MFLFLSVIPATLWVVLGFFILYTSTKAQGQLQTFGRILAIVVFVIGASFPMLGAYATFAGLAPMEAMESMHSGIGR